MKKVLFYGSISKKNESKVSDFLEELIKQLLSDDYIILTREGTTKPEDYSRIWLDNMILDIACKYRDKNKLAYERVVSFIMNDDENVSPHERQRILISSSNRFDGYQEMMEQCDVIISIGGAEGVYRLGLFAAAKKKLFIPLAIDDGTSRKLVKELKEYLTKEFSPDIFHYISYTELDNADIRRLVGEIDQCIFQINERTAQTHVITRQQFEEFIESNSSEILKLPLLKVAKLLSLSSYSKIVAFLVAYATLIGGIVWSIAQGI